MTTPMQIYKQLSKQKDWQHISVGDVRNDLYWMKKNSRKWLSGHALEGFVFSTQQTLEQLRDIELELQSLRSVTSDVSTKLSIIHELKDTINMRWAMEGDGPALMALNAGHDTN